MKIKNLKFEEKKPHYLFLNYNNSNEKLNLEKMKKKNYNKIFLIFMNFT